MLSTQAAIQFYEFIERLNVHDLRTAMTFDRAEATNDATEAKNGFWKIKNIVLLFIWFYLYCLSNGTASGFYAM